MSAPCPKNPRNGEMSEEIHAPGTGSGRVLVAEDDPTMRQMVQILLMRRKIPAVTVADGREAVQAWESGEFDLIFMDLQMPDVDGFEATRTIREKERARGTHIPIVAMTAHAMTGDQEKCLQAGMDDYLAKPIDFTRFYSLIEHYTHRG